jgi:hypothetical protein
LSADVQQAINAFNMMKEGAQQLATGMKKRTMDEPPMGPAKAPKLNRQGGPNTQHRCCKKCPWKRTEGSIGLREHQATCPVFLAEYKVPRWKKYQKMNAVLEDKQATQQQQ